MPADTEFGVFEIGMNSPGEIEPLSRLVAPDVAIVMNVLPVHLGNFLNIEEIRKEKLSITRGLREGGEPRVLVHPDDARDIRSGDVVELAGAHGSLHIVARVTEDTRPGTVVAEGSWWPLHGRDGKGINTLTSNRLTDLGGGATFHDNRVALGRP